MKKISYLKYHRDRDYQRFESMFRNIFQKRVNLISKYIQKKGKVLEVGASTGTFLEIFKNRGWEVWGVEPSQSGEVAKKKGIKVIKSYFENANLPTKYFNLVIMNHTLEHMEDPLTVLKKAHSVLVKNGIVFIDVPNYGGLGSKLLGRRWPYLLPQEHLHQFTKKDLIKIFKDAGFKVLDTQSRSGIFEYANPTREFFNSLFSLKKRFFVDLITFPFALLATLIDMGDSISIVGKKV